MGFFKQAISKVKRVVSLNNLTRAITGDFVGIGKDAMRIVTTQAPVKGVSAPDTTFLKDASIPKPVLDVLTQKGADFKALVTAKTAEIPVVTKIGDYFTSAYLKAKYTQYKTYIWIVVGLVVVYVAWRKLRKPKYGKKYSKY